MTLRDSSLNPYIDIENVRITMVDKSNKPSQKDWAGTMKYLRIQAYTGKGKSLHRGAELPVEDVGKILEFIGSISDAGQTISLKNQKT